jgi:DNA-binding XRE family transcriptional regulator
VTLKAQKPSEKPYPKSLLKIGDQIKKRRLDLNLTHKQAAKLIEVQAGSICNWEHGYVTPKFISYSKLYDSLDMCHLSYAKNPWGDKIKVYRIENGINQRKLAKLLSVVQTTIRDWERNKHKPNETTWRKISDFLILIF